MPIVVESLLRVLRFGTIKSRFPTMAGEPATVAIVSVRCRKKIRTSTTNEQQLNSANAFQI